MMLNSSWPNKWYNSRWIGCQLTKKMLQCSWFISPCEWVAGGHQSSTPPHLTTLLNICKATPTIEQSNEIWRISFKSIFKYKYVAGATVGSISWILFIINLTIVSLIKHNSNIHRTPNYPKKNRYLLPLFTASLFKVFHSPIELI